MITATLIPQVTVEELEVQVDNLDLKQTVAIYKRYGCLVVRGLSKVYADDMYRDIMTTVKEAASQLDQAVKKTEGWVTPNGCLFLPAPEHFEHDKQVMTVGISYYTSSAFLNSATDQAVSLNLEAR